MPWLLQRVKEEHIVVGSLEMRNVNDNYISSKVVNALALSIWPSVMETRTVINYADLHLNPNWPPIVVRSSIRFAVCLCGESVQ